MGVLDDYLRHLLTLKNSPKAGVATTKKGNILFTEANLAMLILSFVPMTWQNLYNLMHQMVLELPRTLLLDLENIKHVINEMFTKKLKAKAKSAMAHLMASLRREGHLEVAHLNWFRRRHSVRSFARASRCMAASA